MRSIILACWLVLGSGCTTAAPWGVEGTAGSACYPDDTCDPGLTCVAGRCTTGSSGGDGSALPEAGPRPDGPLPADHQRLDQPAGCKNPLPPPTLLPYSKSTSLTEVAIRGSAPGAIEVQVSGSSGFSQTVPVASDLFCALLPLKKNTQNGFQLRARDAQGCVSEAVFIGIVQADAGPVNLLYGLIAKTKDAPDDGTLSELTDGQTNAAVRFSFSDPEITPASCDNFEYLWFDLGSTQTFDQFVVRYPQKTSFKYYLTCWEILISKVASPAPPDPKHPDWTSIKMSQSGSASQLSVPLPGTQARHVALLMYEDGGSGIWETFELTEVEAWGTPPTPPTETCP